jgi:hypothetical protein
MDRHQLATLLDVFYQDLSETVRTNDIEHIFSFQTISDLNTDILIFTEFEFFIQDIKVKN